MHSDDGRFLDSLLNGVVVLQLLRLLDASAQLGKASDDKVADLLVVGVARDQEHVPCDSLFEHLLARDVIIAERKEDPSDIGLYHLVTLLASAVPKSVEQVEHSSLYEDLDGLGIQRKVHQRQSTKLLHDHILVLIPAELHNEVNHAVLDDLIEQLLVVGQQRNGQHRVRADRTRIGTIGYLDHKLKQVDLDDLVEHVLVEGNEGGEPGELLENVHVGRIFGVSERRHLLEYLSKIVVLRKFLAMTFRLNHV